MDRSQLLVIFTVVQVLLFGGLGYAVVTGSWNLVTPVVGVGALVSSVFVYWYVGADRE